MTLRIPARLTAPKPGWVISADVIVVGSGIAGLTAALRLRQRVDRVLLVTKTVLAEGSTQWAQGGIAAALDPADSPDEHLVDTLVAGAGVCDVLDHLTSPHRIKAPVRQRPGSFWLNLPQVELGVTHTRAPQWLGGDVDPYHLCPRMREPGG